MVIACESCSTRFHLDESRIPARGARVRCSRCKHAFFVRPPGASLEEAVEEVVAEATGRPGSAPEPAFDLPVPAHAEGSAPSGAEDEESDWQFNLDPSSSHAEPVSAAAPAPAAARGERAAPRERLGAEALESYAEPEPEPFAESREGEGLPTLEELGSPESWSFFSEHEEPMPSPRPAAAPAPREAKAAPEPRAQVRAARSFAEVVSSEEYLARIARASAWALVALLTLLALRGAILAGRVPAALESPPVAVVGLHAEGVRGRLVENALAGPVFVVSGSLVNHTTAAKAPEARMHVRLLGDVESAPGGSSAEVGTPLPDRTLREDDPARVREALARSAAALAATPIAPGERVEFQALFERLPAAATGFVLEGEGG